MRDEIRRNYRILKSAKYVFLAMAFITFIAVTYFMLFNDNSKVSQKDTKQTSSKEKETDIKFKVNAPNLKGVSIEHGPYFIKADEMQEVAGEVTFIHPVVRLMIKHQDWLETKSKRASLTSVNNDLRLFENVRANLNNLYYLETEQADVLAKESTIKSSQYSKLYTIDQDLESNAGFIVNYNNQTAFFYGKINANIKDNETDQVTNIKSDKFDIFWKQKTGNFIGNVVMLKEGTKVESNEMRLVMNAVTNKIEKIYLYGKVKILNEEQTATGEYGEYTVATSILTLKDGVKLIKNGNIITGELLHYNFRFKHADLVGENKGKGIRVRAVINNTKVK